MRTYFLVCKCYNLLETLIFSSEWTQLHVSSFILKISNIHAQSAIIIIYEVEWRVSSYFCCGISNSLARSSLLSVNWAPNRWLTCQTIHQTIKRTTWLSRSERRCASLQQTKVLTSLTTVTNTGSRWMNALNLSSASACVLALNRLKTEWILRECLKAACWRSVLPEGCGRRFVQRPLQDDVVRQLLFSLVVRGRVQDHRLIPQNGLTHAEVLGLDFLHLVRRHIATKQTLQHCGRKDQWGKRRCVLILERSSHG